MLQHSDNLHVEQFITITVHSTKGWEAELPSWMLSIVWEVCPTVLCPSTLVESLKFLICMGSGRSYEEKPSENFPGEMLLITVCYALLVWFNCQLWALPAKMLAQKTKNTGMVSFQSLGGPACLINADIIKFCWILHFAVPSWTLCYAKFSI